ncbi:HrpE/YscL family type III secretion apparatus protein [[Erwinia] mediterraneensis]|uniref:HrpE/YscL family type III secretion apparatus protein n=1 Tax=[Erwinia] mediterraneensis TaxID=2161819 RepID=UPI0010304E19|nr:HrpE/YscL family type III secretion apparatus protein [[Erwinia] mediterraneensis]
MWIQKRLTLADPALLAGETVVTRDVLARQREARDCLAEARQQAEHLVEQAREQAGLILAQAQQQATQLLEQARHQAQLSAEDVRAQAEAAFIAESQHFFDQWQQQQQRQQHSVEAECDALLQAVLSQLLGECPPSTQIRALLRQLQQATPPGEACRLCAPASLLDELQQMSLPWPLEQDDTLPADALCLRADSGEMRIRWHTLRQQCMTLLTE